MATSSVALCNRALQLLGAARITSLSDNSTNARAMAVAYEPIRQRELRARNWGFSIKRAQLPASATPPAFGRANSFPLPSDYLKLLPPYPEDNFNNRDWVIEQDDSGAVSVSTDDSAPLEIRYIADVTDPNLMDASFREALSHALAMACCEELTQSSTKKGDIAAEYTRVVREAKQSGSIENVPQQAAEDTFITCRA